MPITPPPTPQSRVNLLKGFLRVFLPLCLALAIVGGMHYYSDYTTERNTREASESLNVDLARRMIAADIRNVVGDLKFLAEHIERQGVLDDLTYLDEKRIAQEFSVFAKQKVLYDQIRYLNHEGMEIVRVNYSRGLPKVVPQRELQNKANRYYFKEALSESPGGIYLSPLDLNIEGGRIEYPLKPVMRFGMPVFDQQGNKRGIVLLNYFGRRMIDNFKRAAANIADHIALINADGYWLSSNNSEEEWAFMFDRDTRFSKRYPHAWEIIGSQAEGQFQSGQGLFTFTTVYPVSIALNRNEAEAMRSPEQTSADTANYWKIVSRVSPRELSATLPFFIQRHFSLYLAMLTLLAIGAWFLAHSRFRHHLAEAQRDYEQRFRHTLENIDLAAIALNRAGKVTFCNDYFLGMTGWHRNEVVGISWLGRFVPSNMHLEVERVIGQMGDPESFPAHFENHVKTRSGSLRLIAWNNTLSYDAEGKVIGVTGIGEDITDQRRDQEELRKLSRAVEQSPSIVIITSRQGLIEYVNPKFTEVTGYQPEEVLGQNPRILKSGETTEEEYSDLWSTVSGGREWRGEFHNRKKSGELYWESAAISAIRDADGEITHFLAVKEDITERKRLESEIESHNRELIRTQSLTAMGRMASMIAHDLRNPLSSVKMTLQILGRTAGAKENTEAMELREISLEQIRYMEEILSDLLTFSRPGALKPEWVTIERLIDVAVGIAQRKLDEFNIHITTRYHPGMPTLWGDATKLRQVFSNLISNAAQATEGVENPTISIDAMLELGPQGTGIRVEICDNGCGIEAKEREKLFEPFYTTRAKGTGLGLAIVKRILEQHQARIEIFSREPRGSCFSVVLPVSPQCEEIGTEVDS